MVRRPDAKLPKSRNWRKMDSDVGSGEMPDTVRIADIEPRISRITRIENACLQTLESVASVRFAVKIVKPCNTPIAGGCDPVCWADCQPRHGLSAELVGACRFRCSETRFNIVKVRVLSNMPARCGRVSCVARLLRRLSPVPVLPALAVSAEPTGMELNLFGTLTSPEGPM